MTIHHIPYPDPQKKISSWNLEADLDRTPRIDDYPSRVKALRSQCESLRRCSIETLLTFFDTLATRWASRESPFLKKFSPLGVSFLLAFMRRSSLEPLLKESLRGNLFYLDTFQESPHLGQKIMAHPRGVVTHWLAGNVPVLGMISLLQGILSKNANVVKLPRRNGLSLPAMVSEMAHHTVQGKNGFVLKGNELLEGILFVYCEKTDLEAQRLLSESSDVRVAWGGKEAVESVLSLPKRYGTEDVIFGPKYSFAVVANDVPSEEMERLAESLAVDASVFEQRGCNSPHTVFVEKGGPVTPLDFAKTLAQGMEKALKRIPKGEVSSEEAYAVVKARTRYELQGEVFASKGTEWTVIYSEEEGCAEPSFSRVLFVRPIADIEKVLPLVNAHHQTMGLAIGPKRKLPFAQKATERGIERVTDIGKMSFFDYPWDGLFPIDRFVRWVSLP